VNIYIFINVYGYIYIWVNKYTDMCMDIYVYTGIKVYIYIFIRIYVCVYMVPKKNYNVSVFTGIYSVFISFWQICLKELLFFTHCYSSLFWQQYMVGFQGDNINNIINHIYNI
jgi:hypothetical protein